VSTDTSTERNASLERQIFDYIVAHLERHGYQPSIREICTAFSIKSTKTVADAFVKMAAMGLIEIGKGRSRGVRLCGVRVTVKDPNAAAGDDPTLIKPIEEWTEAEREKLVEGDPEAWSQIEGDYLAVTAVRARLVAGEETFSRGDVATCLNCAESVRVMGHWAFALADRNRQVMQKRLSAALCAFCDWTYTHTFEVPEERALTPEEVAEADSRINAAIREHIKTCPNHPMRAMERELAAWQDFAEHLEHCVVCGETSPNDCFVGGQLRDAARPATTVESRADG
jgi:hypothetical protein